MVDSTHVFKRPSPQVLLKGVKRGCWLGIKGGFAASLLTALGATLYFILTTPGGPSDEDILYTLIFAPYVATVVGIVPSLLVGGITGILLGLSFYWGHDRVKTNTIAALLGMFLGASLAAPLMMIWLSFLGSTKEQFVMNYDYFWWLIGPCILVGLYTGLSLYRGYMNT